ncbi:hypothetical protein ABZZ16_31045, partial [Streptomyces sp. NPDC006386]
MTSPLPSGETLSQPVLNPPASVAVFLVATIDPGGEAAVREVLGSLAGLVRSVGFPSPDGGLGCVAGVGSRACRVRRRLADPEALRRLLQG